ncbi:MAG: SLBB domain-containing protein [Verrucomicrobia bacterium]|nr:SLBB domain-containing protein [Verrucomicrobiota bacterium]
MGTKRHAVGGGWRHAARQGMLALGLGLVMAGCASNPLAGQRVAAFTPDVQARDRMPWKSVAQADSSKDPSTVREQESDGTLADFNAGTSDEQNTAVATESQQLPGTGGSSSPTRVLRRDDRLTIALRGIPRPEEIVEIIDSDGHVNLSYIGLVKLEGLSTAEAENVIEHAYVDRGIYRSVNVSILSQEDAYFVRGEVMRPGKYPLTGDTTLVMAIIAAGGYTDFAKPSRIKVIRGDEVLIRNATRIEAREVKDFLIQDNDVIVVDRRIVF